MPARHMASSVTREKIPRSRPASQADTRLDNEPQPAPAPRRQRPSSASPSCRYEDAADAWVKRRLELRCQQAPGRNANQKLTVVERNALLKRAYSQPLKPPGQLKRSASGKVELRKHDAKENRPKPRLNLSGIQTMETRMRQCAQFFGYDSVQVRLEATKIVKLGNKIAMKSLDKGNVSQALAVLKRAEAAGKLFTGLNSLTYNNIACAYKRLGRLEYALESVEEALACYKSGTESARCIALADIRLNYGVILSAMQRHREALSQVRSAIRLLQQELFSDAEDDCCPSLLEAVRWSHSRHRLGIFPVALYNLAIELEILDSKNRALEAYRLALYFAKHLLGRRHSTTVTLEERYRRYQVLLGSHKPSEMGLSWVCDGTAAEDRACTKKAASKCEVSQNAIKISLPWSMFRIIIEMEKRSD